MKLKNLLSSLNTVAQVALVFLIVIFGYMILRTYHFRLDFSKDKVYSLSPQTKRILGSFEKQPVRALAFFRENQLSRNQLQNLLKEYSYHQPSFHYEFYDPDRYPLKAREYKVEDYETLIIEYDGKQQRTKRFSEEGVTNTLAKLLLNETKTVVFAKGLGGPVLEDEKERNGYGLFREALMSSNYQVKEAVLSKEDIPKKTDLLVLAGVHVDLMPEEIQTIRDYWRKGGNILFLIDPVDPGEGKSIDQLLLNFGVELTDDVVVDKTSKLFGGDYLIPIVTDYKAHSITKGFRFASFFPVARTVRKSAKSPANLEVIEIAWTGAGSWAERNLKRLEGGAAEYNDKEDQIGPLPIMVTISKIKGNGRMAVFGDSDFANNRHLNLSGNKDFILNTIAWLVGDDTLITLRPRQREATPLFLTSAQQAFLFFGPVMTPPFVFLVLGAWVFFYRRRYR